MLEDAFITSVPPPFNNKKRVNSDKLVNVRKDHAQLMDIVKKFGSKVSTMVDNQRIDYMAAYENHMLDVQKELYLLREKVQEIATDGTRDEKIKSLEDAQTKYKSESVLLDQQNNEMRKKLRSLTVTMQSAERDRDWLLSRLRKAKKKFSALESEYDLERSKNAAEESMYSTSMNVSQESSLLLGLYNKKLSQMEGTGSQKLIPINPVAPPPRGTWKGRLAATLAVTRSDPFDNPHNNNNNSSDVYGTYNSSMHRSQSLNGARRDKELTIARQSSAPSLYQQNGDPQKRGKHEKSKAEKNNISSLVLMRERKKGIRDLLDKCSKLCTGSVQNQGIGFDSLSELVLVCLESIEENICRRENIQSKYDNTHNNFNNEEEEGGLEDVDGDEGQYRRELEESEQRTWLASLLIAHPETFYAILDILAGKFLPPSEEKALGLGLGTGTSSMQNTWRKNNKSEKMLNNLANFDSSTWLNGYRESNADYSQSLHTINRLKNLKSLRSIGTSENRKFNKSRRSSTELDADNKNQDHASSDEHTDPSNEGSENVRDPDLDPQDPDRDQVIRLRSSDDRDWKGFCDSIGNSLCEEASDEGSVGAMMQAFDRQNLEGRGDDNILQEELELEGEEYLGVDSRMQQHVEEYEDMSGGGESRMRQEDEEGNEA